MILIGHRGLAGLAPENTLASFEAAAAHGLSMVEFDVRLTRDCVPIVFHDDTLERTSDGTGPVAERDWAELALLDAGAWFSPDFAGQRIPRLDQVLRLCLDLGLAVNMEVKPDRGREELTAETALAQALAVWPDSLAPPLLSSFETSCLEVARRCAPHWPRGLLAEAPSEERLGQCRALAAQSLHLDHRSLDESAVWEIVARGLEVRAYTVNDSVRARLLGQWGVAAVFSDYPQSS